MNRDFCRAFGIRVRELRSRIGWSQEKLADESGLHRTYVGGVERGERNPTLLIIKRLADALGVPPAELLRVDGQGLGEAPDTPKP